MTNPLAEIDPQVLWRILEVTRKLSAPMDLDELLQQVIDAARAVLDADRGTVFLYDEPTHELYARVATGEREIRFPADKGIAGQTAQSRTIINVSDCYGDERFNAEVDRKTGYRTRCLLAVPLVGFDDKLVGVMQLLNKHTGVFTESDEQITSALAAQCAVALQRATLMVQYLEKQKIERALELARDIQRRVLPQAMPTVSGYDLAGWSEPADQTGGDIYDGVQLDKHRAMLLMGDATGHGIGPALSVTQVRAMMRMATRLHAGLDDVFLHINAQLADDLAANRFVTAFIGVLDARTHTIAYHSGGQGPLLHYRAADTSIETLGASTLPMGITDAIPLEAPPPIAMAPGDILALISDGIYEAMDANKVQFNQPQVERIIRQHHDLPMLELIEKIRSGVEQYTAGAPRADDMTIVLARRLASVIP